MNMNDSIVRSVLRNASVAVVTATLFAATAAGDDFAELARLTQADGEQYITLRNSLLARHIEPWDVSGAAAQSWEFGIAAYILNRRMKEKEAFKRLDDAHPASYVSVNGYGRLSRSPEANTAFLLEKLWKAPHGKGDEWLRITPDQDRQYAYNTLAQSRHFRRAGETALWKAIWEQSEDDRFRFVAIRQVCADPDPSVQPIILQVLHHEDVDLGPDFKYRCLSGLVRRDTEETVDAIFGALDVLRNANRMDFAIAVLAANGSTRARPFVHEFILNPENHERRRVEALAKCCNRPHPDDVSVFRKFLASEVSKRVKADAVRSLSSCPLDLIRPFLGEILMEWDDHELVANAALALSIGHLRATKADSVAAAEDVALFEAMTLRDDLPEVTRIHIGRYITNIHERQAQLAVKPDDR